MGPQSDVELADLCRAEYPRLVGLLALYVGSRAVAEDLAQESLIRLHMHWPRVRTMPSPHAWLCGVGINQARSWWRRRFAEQRANRRAHGRPEETTVEPADVLAVRTAVAALPPRQRGALVLRYYGGLSVEETAAHLGCARGTVKSLTSRAIDALRTSLAVDAPDLAPLGGAPDARHH